ncbi:hypothetical protein [Sinorhizobium psoraleae]|uniref:hypothetical protein n=1 Tax=Sinorhizobium psoraleae TaxID=520838 RepID=UPI001568329B|nr:hypothetical protein [Sinorhizobium psoraleae]
MIEMTREFDARLAILDDQLDELEATREKLVLELANAEAPAEDFQVKIAKLKALFNPADIEISIRKLLFLARNHADEHAKQRLMPIVRDFIQTVVIGKTPGHQPASLQVHGSIANIMASMEGSTCLSSSSSLRHRTILWRRSRRERSTRSTKRKSSSTRTRRSFL